MKSNVAEQLSDLDEWNGQSIDRSGGLKRRLRGSPDQIELDRNRLWRVEQLPVLRVYPNTHHDSLSECPETHEQLIRQSGRTPFAV